MFLNEYEKLSAELKEKGEMAFLPAAAEDRIIAFEESHNVRLPKKYKEWLQFSDGGEFFLPAGLQMYGVDHKPYIDVEDQDKPEEKYLVIGKLASGEPVLCDTTCEKISIYNHEAGCIEEDETYEDFTEFLNDLHNILGIGG